jgi:hypothetical protein
MPHLSRHPAYCQYSRPSYSNSRPLRQRGSARSPIDLPGERGAPAPTPHVNVELNPPGALSWIVAFGAMASRFPAPAGRVGNRASTEIGESGKLAEQVSSLGLQLKQGAGHGGTSFSKRTHTLRMAPPKMTRSILDLHIARPLGRYPW